MAAIGSVWAQASWANNVWATGTWADAFVPPSPSGRDIGPGWPISDLIEESRHEPKTTEHELSGHLTYHALTFTLSGRVTSKLDSISGTVTYSHGTWALSGSAAVDDRPAREDEAFLLGLILGGA